MSDSSQIESPSWIELLNEYGKKRRPCFFLIDFEIKNIIVLPLDQLNNISFDFNGAIGGKKLPTCDQIEVTIKKDAIDYKTYLGQFMDVQQHIKYGNSFLINLTHKTPIEINLSLEEIFHLTKAKYKLYFRDQFVMFSPESFITIKNSLISTFPMKGTIDANVIGAREKILADVKESAEHYTIVDLLRNDLSRVAKSVRVERFRYIDEINTNSGKLLQVSSQICGQLEEDWQSKMGTILNRMLPAGSISGAPKDKSVDIIRAVEVISRGYYTGITGIFDGENLDSGVCIRFIEEEFGQKFFRSGCGITNLSEPYPEYQEMINKIYVPIG